MSEQATIEAPAVTTPAPAVESAVEPPALNDGASSVEPPTPVDEPVGAEWRKILAGDDDKRLKELERYADPATFLASFENTKKALRESGRIKLPGKDAAAEDLTQFREALGIPDAPDKYQIDVKPPEGVTLSDADTQFIQKQVAKLHATNGFAASPEVVGMFQQAYYEAIEEQAAQRLAMAQQAREVSAKNLKAKWGQDFDINRKYAEGAVTAYFNADKAEDVLNIQLADGSLLGDYQEFVEAMSRAGRATIMDPNFLQTLTAPGMDGDGLEREIKRIYGLRQSSKAEDQKEYTRLSAPGGKLEELIARQQQISGRAA